MSAAWRLCFAGMAPWLSAALLLPALPAAETVIRGEPLFRDDFERCQPQDKILRDENRRGFWNLRYHTWGENQLLFASAQAPEITFDPGLRGRYDIEVESRATGGPVSLALKLASEADFTVLRVPNEGATKTRHFNVWLPFRKDVKLDGEKIVIAPAGHAVYLDAFKFTPTGRYTPFRPLAPGEPGPRTGVVCKQMDRYIGWPTVTRTSRGELLIVFSGDRDAHVCPWGKTQMVRSRDEGKTWSSVVTINNSPMDDRDAGILETPRGTLLVSWFTSDYFEKGGWMRSAYRAHAAKLGPETRAQWAGAWVRRSQDGGATWGPPIRTLACAPHGPIPLRDGRLLFVGASGGPDPAQRIVVQESRDDGLSWQTIGHVPVPQDFHAGEPHAVECAGGRLVAQFRNQHPELERRFPGQSESRDGGRTWSPIRLLETWGYPPHLIRLQDGRLLAVYGHRRAPYGQRACLSQDHGQTWGPGIALVDDAPDGDLGYPSSAQLGDGSILTVYYQKDRLEEKPCLMATHWRLPPLQPGAPATVSK